MYILEGQTPHQYKKLVDTSNSNPAKEASSYFFGGLPNMSKKGKFKLCQWVFTWLIR